MDSQGKAWHSGRIYQWDGLGASAGFRQGDGVFETLRTYGGTPFLLSQHVFRLLEGATLLGLKNIPDQDSVEEMISDELRNFNSGNESDEQIIRFAMFHDTADWGFALSIVPMNGVQLPSKGDAILIGYSAYPHPGRYLIPPDGEVQVKWISRGPLAHALRDAKAKGWDEGLLLSQNGEAVEGTRSNLFAIVDDMLFAPGPKSYALPGITRSIVVNLATEMGLKVVDQPVPKAILEISDEIFLTSSLLGIAPVSRIVNGSYAREKVGKITKTLMTHDGDRVSSFVATED